MPNYIITTNLANGQSANALDVKTPLEILDTKAYEALQPMQGASASVDGTGGQVPSPVSGEAHYFLRGDGLWAQIDGGLLSSTPQINQMTWQTQAGIIAAPLDADTAIVYLRQNEAGQPSLYARLSNGYEYKVSLQPANELRMAVTTDVSNVTSEWRFASSNAINIDWGDGNQETVTADTTSSIFHTYAVADTYQVVVTGGVQDLYNVWIGASDNHQNFDTVLDLKQFSQLTIPTFAMERLTVSNGQFANLPQGITKLTLTRELVGLSGTVAELTQALSANFDYFDNYQFTGLSGNYSDLPATATTLLLDGMPYVVFDAFPSTWVNQDVTTDIRLRNMTLGNNQTEVDNLISALQSVNSVRSLRLDGNGLSTTQIDSLIDQLYSMWANLPASWSFNFTNNAIPSGVYQTATTPSTGLEKIYAMVNDPNNTGYETGIWSYA